MWLLVSALFCGVSEYYGKKFGACPSIRLALLTWSIGCVINLSWLMALSNYNSISTIGLIWALLNIVITLFMGFIVFGEPITTLKMIGVVLAFVAVILMCL